MKCYDHLMRTRMAAHTILLVDDGEIIRDTPE
jgi:hypothetical protein